MNESRSQAEMITYLHRLGFRIPLVLSAIFWLFAISGHGFYTTAVPAAEKRAFAFLRNGDLWLSYQGKTRALTAEGNYQDFAISDDGSYLALKEAVKENPSAARVSVIALGRSDPLLTIEVSLTTGLVPTCGTIASLENNAALHRRVAITKNLISRQDFDRQGFADFRCDSKRATTIGYRSLDDRSLSVLGHLEKKASLQSVPDLFAVSGDGHFAGFYAVQVGASQLCAWEIGNAPTCLANVDVFDRVSVSESGELLFATDSGTSCLFLDGEHYSTTPKQGYDTGDQCPGVAHWHKGMAEPEILQLLARHPQWLTSEAAAQLDAWHQ